jgi:predicted dinucleotide-binding enzyme
MVADGRLRPIDAGPLRRAQQLEQLEQLEQLGFLPVSLQQPHELGFGSTVKLHP